jgi:CO/xanthine dehydrogenase FAD-binding subunit
LDVLTPRSLAEALALKAELPDARLVQGGTDVLVELNFDRSRPAVLINLNEVAELGGFASDGDTVVLGAGLTYAEAMTDPLAGYFPALAEASRTVGSPQIRNRGTIGGNLGTSSPAGDALPPLVIGNAEVCVASVRGERRIPIGDFIVGVKKNALASDEIVVSVRMTPSGARQTFMKVGPRNAMVISVCSLALEVDRERDEIRAAFGSSAPTVRLVTCSVDEADAFPVRVAEAASPIDDVRGTAAYRRHALRVLTARALERCFA